MPGRVAVMTDLAYAEVNPMSKARARLRLATTYYETGSIGCKSSRFAVSSEHPLSAGYQRQKALAPADSMI